jgi:hypothetical protein
MKDGMGPVRAKHSSDHSVPEECLISRTVREIRTARKKELSLFVSSERQRKQPQSSQVIANSFVISRIVVDRSFCYDCLQRRN